MQQVCDKSTSRQSEESGSRQQKRRASECAVLARGRAKAATEWLGVG